eukprot:12084746-Alexandrium_andersonii.AAC.1
MVRHALQGTCDQTQQHDAPASERISQFLPADANALACERLPIHVGEECFDPICLIALLRKPCCWEQRGGKHSAT